MANVVSQRIIGQASSRNVIERAALIVLGIIAVQDGTGIPVPLDADTAEAFTLLGLGIMDEVEAVERKRQAARNFVGTERAQRESRPAEQEFFAAEAAQDGKKQDGGPQPPASFGSFDKDRDVAAPAAKPAYDPSTHYPCGTPRSATVGA